ncbi:MAG: hypothetical protein ACW98D_16685 [Promethearchaeota archaeon]
MKALKKSFVDVSSNISDKDLFLVIERELIKGNGYLLYHLSVLLKSEMNTSNGEYKSNTWGQVLQGVAPLLGGLFGGKKGDDGQAMAQAQAQAQNDQMMMQFQMAQQQAQADAQRRDAQKRDDDARRRSTNMMVFGGIGAVVVIGLVVFLATRPKK